MYRKWKTRKQNGRFSVTLSRTIQILKKKRLSLLVKTSEEKENKGVKKRNVIDRPCECNISTFLEEHFSSENT